MNQDEDVKKILHLANKGRAHGDITHVKSNAKDGACRFEGSFKVHKVTGMLHFTVLGHGHGGAHVNHDQMNFTHRIDRLSFGPLYPGIKNPLDHTLEFAHSSMSLKLIPKDFDNFQYFVAIVPTIYIDHTRLLFEKVLLTNQYAVTEHQHTINQEHPDNFPGIFIKYSIEPISVRITARKRGLVEFITRFCGIIGGIYVTFGALVSFTKFVTKRWSANGYQSVQKDVQ